MEVDNLLAKAWEITLREIGETVTIGAAKLIIIHYYRSEEGQI